MAYVSITRLPIKAGSGAELERIAKQALAGRQRWKEQGDLLATYVARSDDQGEYVLVSVWVSRAADEAHEDDPADQQAMRDAGPLLAGQPSVFTGEVVAELA